MSRIFYAWELGANLGHVGTFAPVSAVLDQRGHEVFIAARETVACARFFGASRRWLQAPIGMENSGRGAPANYADILLLNGYADPDVLFGLVVAWQQLLLLTKPQLLLADHSPTAILAARTLGIPVMLFGSGFFSPPRTDPFPSMRPWQLVADELLLNANRQALDTVNDVLRRLSCSPLASLCDLFRVAENGLLTLPELDHYPHRDETHYWGFITDGKQNKKPLWPAGNGRRVFAYLRDGHPHSRGVLQSLARSGCSLIAYLPGSTLGDEFAALPNVHVSREPLDMACLVREADAAVLNGGISSAAAFLLAGKPVLNLPLHLEQFLTAWNVLRMGAGLLISPQDIAPGIGAVVARLLEDSSLRGAAGRFAAKYAHLDQTRVVSSLVDRIESLCASDALVPKSHPQF